MGDDDARPATARLGPAATLWGLAAVSYLTAEAVAASAYPGYSYSRDYISDLGELQSPLASIMNAGFVVQGVLFALATTAAVRAWRRDHLLVVPAVVHAAGNVLVAVVHGGEQLPAHTLGAGMAIVGGNLAVLAVGVVLRRRGVAPGLGTAGVVLGVVGLVALLGLLAGTGIGVPPGVWERGSVYSITLWELVAAGVVLLGHRTRRAA